MNVLLAHQNNNRIECLVHVARQGAREAPIDDHTARGGPNRAHVDQQARREEGDPDDHRVQGDVVHHVIIEEETDHVNAIHHVTESIRVHEVLQLDHEKMRIANRAVMQVAPMEVESRMREVLWDMMMDECKI